MKKEEILNAIRSLAASNGFYGRLLSDLSNDKLLGVYLEYLEEQNFKDAVDLVMFLES